MQAAAAQAHGKAGSPAAHGLPRNHPPAGPAGRAALADVVGLVLANAAVAWTQAERAALRLVCRDVCEARDAAARPGGLTIRVGGVPEGAEGAAQVARFFGRPGRRLPNSLTVQCVTSGQQERCVLVGDGDRGLVAGWRSPAGRGVVCGSSTSVACGGEGWLAHRGAPHNQRVPRGGGRHNSICRDASCLGSHLDHAMCPLPRRPRRPDRP